MAKKNSQKMGEQGANSRARNREEDVQINKMKQYPPSLNGINKNLP
ncbi:hypothetical protein [Cohnella sp. WQ 127256]|nr:hypothetical protein [Cohnella sp. WQ 127256]